MARGVRGAPPTNSVPTQEVIARHQTCGGGIEHIGALHAEGVLRDDTERCGGCRDMPGLIGTQDQRYQPPRQHRAVGHAPFPIAPAQQGQIDKNRCQNGGEKGRRNEPQPRVPDRGHGEHDEYASEQTFGGACPTR